jgi:hypothetical protein
MSKQKNNPRQIRYNMTTEPYEQAEWGHFWTFFLLNSRRECDRIQEKLLMALAPCGELEKTESGILVPKGSLVGRVITFASTKGRIIDPQAIYKTDKWYHDRGLHPMSGEQFGRYIERFTVSS